MDIFGNGEGLFKDKKSRRIHKIEEFDYSFSDQDVGSETKIDTTGQSSRTLLIIKVGILLIFSAIFVKLFISQVVLGKLSEEMANGNKIRPRILTAMRGVVQDSKGTWLARNVPTYDLALYPSDLPKDSAQRQEIYNKLSALTSISAGDIKTKAETNGLFSLDQVTLKENLTHDDALILEEKVKTITSVFISKRASREYKGLPGIAHILGYTGKVSEDDLKNHPDYLRSDWIGKTGLESTYEQELKGINGVEQIEVDSRGNVVRALADNNNREPISGKNLSLYLDADLQQKSGEFLQQGLESAKLLTGNQDINSGVVVVMNPNNGGILAMVSLPDYNDNLFANGISNADYEKLANDPAKPLLNRATSGVYPPGSTIKIMMATAGLAEKAITTATAFDTPLEIVIDTWKFPDWKDHGVTNIFRAIAESNNIFFYSIGGGFDKIKGLGINKIKEWWQKFGLGAKSHIDLPSEASGLLPDATWKKKTTGESWYIGDTYHVSIGQGDLLATPIQMIKIVSVIANGGKLISPQLVQKVTDESGKVIREYGPRIENSQVAPPEVIAAVQQGMRMAVTEGSAKTMGDLPVTSAGKTGTAEFLNNQKTHAWFECYAPYENPQVAVIVLVEGGGGGHEIALPVAKNILQYYFTR